MPNSKDRKYGNKDMLVSWQINNPYIQYLNFMQGSNFYFFCCLSYISILQASVKDQLLKLIGTLYLFWSKQEQKKSSFILRLNCILLSGFHHYFTSFWQLPCRITGIYCMQAFHSQSYLIFLWQKLDVVLAILSLLASHKCICYIFAFS